MKKVTVRQVDIKIDNYIDLPVLFTGLIKDCHKYCQSLGHEWKRDDSIFGGYYCLDNYECLVFV